MSFQIIILVIIGLAIAYAFYSARTEEIAEKKKYKGQTKGTITAFYPHNTNILKRQFNGALVHEIIYYPVVKFQVDNDDVTFVDKQPRKQVSNDDIGKEVHVIYDPKKPEDAKIIHSNTEIWNQPQL